MAFPQASAPLRVPRSRFGDIVFLLFAIVQIADGWMTYQGIRVYGPGIEANPLIVWYASAFGAAAALTGAKTLAVICGVILHLLLRLIEQRAGDPHLRDIGGRGRVVRGGVRVDRQLPARPRGLARRQAGG